MTATADRPVAAPPHPATGRTLTGTATLVRFMLRRDRVRLPAWAGGLAVFVLYLVTAIPSVYGDDEELAGAVALFADPIGRLLVGPGYGFDAPGLARFIAGGYGLYLLILAALMSLLLVTRHTRVEEQAGRAELVRANVVGRHAPLTATMVMAVITNLAAAVLVALVLIGVGGFPAAGSLLLAAGLGAVGLAFAGITAVTVQLSEYSRAASGMAGIVLGVAFALRAGGDMVREGGSALSWVSPLGWGQQTAPYVLDRWWPLGLAVALAVVTTVAAFALSSRRDHGASLFAVRAGRPTASPSLGTPLGLALRLQRASIIGWTLAMAVGGALFGAFTEALLVAVEDMPEAFRELFGAEHMVDGYLGYMALFMAYLAGVYVILAVQGLRSEETGGRAEPVLATPVSCGAWLGSHLLVTVGGLVVVLAATGLGTGAAAAVVTGEWAYLGALVGAHLTHVPAVLVVLALAALLFGVLPRALPAVWVVVGYAFFVGTFGPLLEVPEVLFDLSPYGHAAEVPAEPFTLAPLVVLTVVAVAVALLGVVGFRRRRVDGT